MTKLEDKIKEYDDYCDSHTKHPEVAAEAKKTMRDNLEKIKFDSMKVFILDTALKLVKERGI